MPNITTLTSVLHSYFKNNYGTVFGTRHRLYHCLCVYNPKVRYSKCNMHCHYPWPYPRP